MRDREIEVALSSDEQVYIQYSENSKEYYEIAVSDENVLTMTSASDKEWTDYIGGKASAEARKILLQIPDTLLENLTLSTTNENISLPALSVNGNVVISSNGGDIAFEHLNVGASLSLTVKNGNIDGTVIGSYDDFAIQTEIKKGDSNLPDNKTDGTKTLNVSSNNGDINIEFVKDEVVQLNYTSQFEVTTVNNIFQAKYVVLATGVSRNVPNIKGIKEFEGKGVSYCAICDAFFYRNKDVAVLGSGNYAIHEAEILKPVVKSVILLTNSEKLVENRDIDLNVNEKKVREVRGFEKVDEIVFEDDTAQNINGIFVAIGTASTNDLARKIGARVENNKIIVNDNLETTVPNLYACGDCTGGILQISKATYEGTKVGLEIVNKLKNKNN